MSGRPLVVADDDAARRAVAAELAGAGWVLQAPHRPRGTNTLVAVAVTDRASAEAAVLAALRGDGLMALAQAERSLVDDLVEDLEHIAPVRFVTAGTGVLLDVDTWRLLHALADGASVGDAAARLHLSVRTANRRLTEARAALRASSRAELMRALAAPRRIPRAPKT